MDELVYVVERSQHGCASRGVEGPGGAGPVDQLARRPVLTVLSGLHVSEEPQDLWVVRGRLPQLVQLPAEQSVIVSLHGKSCQVK